MKIGFTDVGAGGGHVIHIVFSGLCIGIDLWCDIFALTSGLAAGLLNESNNRWFTV